MDTRLIDRDGIRALDRRAIDEFAMPGAALMESAGRVAADLLIDRLARRGHSRGARVAIACGRGNNGGDGYVIARHLMARGHRAHVLLLAAPDTIEGDAAINLAILGRMRDHDALTVETLPVDDEDALTDRLADLRDMPFDAWVDALLGTGLSSPVRGVYKCAIRLLRAVRRRRPAPLVMAVDTPSGLDVDTGQILGDDAVHADLTVTFGLAKPGLHLEPGRSLRGELHVVDLGFPAPVLDDADIPGELLVEHTALDFVRPRRAGDHKGTNGHTLVIAGTPGKTGAAVLSGAAALRAGAGLVTVGTHPDNVSAIAMVSWELMAEAVVPTAPGGSLERLREVLDGKDVVAIGPGLGDTETTTALLAAVIEHTEVPVVVDADGLNAAARDLSLLEGARGRLVLTPHPGEMGRLIGRPTRELLPDRLEHARSFAAEHGAIVVLKTSDTIVAHPDGRYAINTSGSPALGTAGTGDVLTGIIAALIGQGLEPWAAARTGVFVHGRAGEHAAALLGERATTASAVIDALAPVLRGLESKSRA